MGGRCWARMVGTNSRKPNMVTWRSPSFGRFVEQRSREVENKKDNRKPTTTKYMLGRQITKREFLLGRSPC